MPEIGLKHKLEEAIVETIAFFDMFNFPLTEFEIWQYSKIKCHICDINNCLADSGFMNKYKIKKYNGFYFIKDKEINIQKRANRYNFSERKFKRAVWITRLFSCIPWIKLVAVGNIMGANNLKNNGDIDLFIISKDRRIWLSRLFCVSIIKLLNLRPKPGREKDTICLSFFISDKQLNIKHLMLDEDDIYFVYWLAGLTSILNRENAYSDFIQNNKWIKNYLPNWQPKENNSWRIVRNRSNGLIKEIIDLFVGGLEPIVSKWQQKILPNIIKANANKDTRVVITEKIFKTHPNDRREYYKKRYLDTIKSLND